MLFAKSFRANVAVRVLLLALFMFGFLWSLFKTRWDAVPLVLAASCAFMLVELVRYAEAGTRDLARLLESVAASDYTTALPRRISHAPFADYQRASEHLLTAMRSLHVGRMASDELLRAVIDHVGVAMLCFTGNGRVVLGNNQLDTLLGYAAGSSLANLARADARLPTLLQSMRDSEKLEIDVTLRGEPATLLLHSRRFSLLDENYIAVILQDIREELESRDLYAWQALTRVLTHEMMNSLTPIVTLSRHLRDTLAADAGRSDAAESVEVIHERSSGLVRFIESYRHFAHPPAPQQTSVGTRELLDHVFRLKARELEDNGIVLEVASDSIDAYIWADARQVEQVIINLMRNSQQALATQPSGRIELRSATDVRGRVSIHVTDNGPGVPHALRSQIFLPFFTTRKGGTGVGLALSRQLARLNGGTLHASGDSGRFRFTLRLPSIERSS